MVEQRPLKPFVAGSSPAQLIKSAQDERTRSLPRFLRSKRAGSPAQLIKSLKMKGGEKFIHIKIVTCWVKKSLNHIIKKKALWKRD